MNVHVARFVRLAKWYVWGLLVVSNLSFAAIAVVLWLWPNGDFAKRLERYASDQPPILLLR